MFSKIEIEEKDGRTVDCKLAQKLPSSVPVQCQSSWTETSYIITVSPTHPATHPGKYIWATSRLPRKLKFGMEALFNQTRSTSQLASYPLATTSWVAGASVANLSAGEGLEHRNQVAGCDWSDLTHSRTGQNVIGERIKWRYQLYLGTCNYWKGT